MVSCCRSLEPVAKNIESAVHYAASFRIVKGAYSFTARIFTGVGSTATLLGKTIVSLMPCRNKELLKRTDQIGNVARKVNAAVTTVQQLPRASIKDLDFNWNVFSLMNPVVGGLAEGAFCSPIYIPAEMHVVVKGIVHVGFAIMGDTISCHLPSKNMNKLYSTVTSISLRTLFHVTTVCVAQALTSNIIGISMLSAVPFMTGNLLLAYTDLDKVKGIYRTNLILLAHESSGNEELVEGLRNLKTSMEEKTRALDDKSCALVLSYLGHRTIPKSPTAKKND